MVTQITPQKGGGAPSPIFAHVHCGKTAGWIKTALGTQESLGPGHIVLDGDPAPLPQKVGRAPSQISCPFLLWPNGWMHQDATWCGRRPQPRRLCVRWGPSPLPKKGRSPQFSAHVYCGQTAGWIKIPLGTEIGLGPNDIVLYVDPAPLHPTKKGHSSPIIFSPCLFWPNGCGCMYQDTTW